MGNKTSEEIGKAKKCIAFLKYCKAFNAQSKFSKCLATTKGMDNATLGALT